MTFACCVCGCIASQESEIDFDAALRDLFADFGSGDGMVAGCQVLHRAVRKALRVQLAGLICRRDRRTLPQRFARQETFR
ncbi:MULTISPECIES: hypothetical protein [Xanthomonas]|uniref:hypothetical protein n=1 Tax=Xanthomonas TaxID=338 RepID=UPI0011180F80|nr:hypothetical protein [Xanthomonas phaseoli]MBO9768357.1 hypothetical protein [Xanthomonas phaseoli pv. dieffenbachiae]MBO9774608.1 hypothetical protein [Xanthomonas phaseoli pv. dieffenbachiae]MBO9779767.1 hypothetical protein [Xanthomonas phaseoli pv. dieffenbachiae]MBO9788487.1 hypothetical protein [Xanthomonas phaseoli pv. dieffenbachiae]MBO9797189.1 hypothetical protein [Xanthomonas phaseoli pv. dieffenbachiae]